MQAFSVLIRRPQTLPRPASVNVCCVHKPLTGLMHIHTYQRLMCAVNFLTTREPIYVETRDKLKVAHLSGPCLELVE